MQHHVTNRRNVTIAVMVATFLTAMDSTVVSTAMPTILSDLGGINAMSWVFAVYLLTTAVTVPIWGKLADLFGRKSVFAIGTALFLVGSMTSGMAQTMDQLIWFRAFQGIGAGAVFPITLTIIGDIYSFEQRARMQGLFSAVWGISGILGPLIGGFFVDWLTWRWIFYINIPIGLASIVLVWMFLHEQFERKQKYIDYWGAVSFTVGMTAFLYALLSGGPAHPWGSAGMLSLFGLAAVALVAFVVIQVRSPEPMVPLKLFRNRVIALSNLATFLTSAILIGLTAYLPDWIQGILGHNATTAGLTLAPLSIGWPLGATLGGRLMLKIGSKLTSIIGTFSLTAGSIWLALVNANSPQWMMGVIMVIVGFGFGFSTTAFTVVVQSSVDWNMRGAATATLQFLRNLSQTVGIAVFGTLFNHSMQHYTAAHFPALSKHPRDMSALLNPTNAKQIPPPLRQALRLTLASGLHNVFVVMVAVAVGGFLVTLWLPSYKPASPVTQSGKPQEVTA